MKPIAVLFCVLAACAALAQQSASYAVTESTFNAGGDPRDGIAPASPGFQVTLHAVGDAVSPEAASSAGYGLGSGFVEWFAPPGEVENLRFLDPATLAWDPDGSVGDYALYQGVVKVPFDPAFGSCLQPPPPLTAATADVSLPAAAPGEALFYLVTARNRLGEESTKGAGRANPDPCP